MPQNEGHSASVYSKTDADAQSFLTTRIHSKIADGGCLKGRNSLLQSAIGHCSVALWYLVRGLDPNGSGWAECSYEQAASILGRSIATIKRYLHQGLTLGLFHNATKTSTTFRVYYQSLFKVCRRFGLTDWGATAEITLESIPHLKLLATEIETHRLQEASRFRATQAHRTPVPSSACVSSSQRSRGVTGVLHRGNRTLFVDQRFPTFGTAQTTIADSLTRCDRTIRNRLSNLNRSNRGLDPLPRLQLAQTTPELMDRFACLLRAFDRSELKMMDGVWKSDLSDRIFVCKNRVFKALCNVYDSEIPLNSMKRSRSAFKRFLQGCIKKASLMGSPLIEDPDPEFRRNSNSDLTDNLRRNSNSDLTDNHRASFLPEPRNE